MWIGVIVHWQWCSGIVHLLKCTRVAAAVCITEGGIGVGTRAASCIFGVASGTSVTTRAYTLLLYFALKCVQELGWAFIFLQHFLL